MRSTGVYRRWRSSAEGPGSALWRELQGVLPPETFSKLAALTGYDETQSREPVRLTWSDLEKKFSAWMVQRVALGKLRDTTRTPGTSRRWVPSATS